MSLVELCKKLPLLVKTLHCLVEIAMATKFSWIGPLGVYLHWPSALESIPAMPEVL